MVRHNAPMRIAVAAGVALLVACAEPEGDTQPVPSRVTGLIVEIRREGGSISSFTVEARDDRSYDIAIDPDRDYGFDLEHLEVHREQRLPVLVRIDERAGVLYAVEILDA
jgi:hypothetical protein